MMAWIHDLQRRRIDQRIEPRFERALRRRRVHRIGGDRSAAFPDRPPALLPIEAVVSAQREEARFGVRTKAGLRQVARSQLDTLDRERCELVERRTHRASLQRAQRDEKQGFGLYLSPARS